jgi:hypothetical protein
MSTQDSRTLTAVLWSLSKEALAAIDARKAAGELVRTNRVYVKTEVTDFKYQVGGQSYSSSYHYIQKPEWHFIDQYAFVQNVVRRLPTYDEAVHLISSRYSTPLEQAKFWLDRFVQRLVSPSSESLQDGLAVELITMLIRDLDKSPIEWSVVAYLNNTWLEPESFDLARETTIRRPQPKDFEYEQPLDSMFPTPTTHHLLPSAILETSIQAREASEAQGELETILDTLRLFRLGSIGVLKYDLRPRSVLAFGGRLGPGPSATGPNQCTLLAADKERLARFVARVKPLVSSNAKGTDDVSLQRFRDAVLSPASPESRVSMGITALESLLMRERSELSHRLSLRTAALLGAAGFPSLQVYNNVRRAYELRNKVVHGSPLSPKDKASAGGSNEAILEYCRLSLVIVLGLKESVTSEQLLNRLDQSLLDESERRALSGDLETVRDLLGNRIESAGPA